MATTYALTAFVTICALIVYLGLGIGVGIARAKYQIMPPRTTGDERFERVYRVHQNTLEQLVPFLPSLWLFSWFVSVPWGAAIGGAWVVGRIIYAWGYYAAAENRMAGFAISSLSGLVLLIGTLIGAGKLVWLQFT